MSGDYLNLSSMYNSPSQPTYSGNGGVNTGGANPESSAQSKDAKIMGFGQMAASVISAVYSISISRLQKQQAKSQRRQMRAQLDLNKARRMSQFGDESQARRRGLDAANTESDFFQAMSGLKGGGTSDGSKKVSEKNYTADEKTARRSLASKDFDDTMITRDKVLKSKSESNELANQNRLNKIKLGSSLINSTAQMIKESNR